MSQVAGSDAVGSLAGCVPVINHDHSEYACLGFNVVVFFRLSLQGSIGHGKNLFMESHEKFAK